MGENKHVELGLVSFLVAKRRYYVAYRCPKQTVTDQVSCELILGRLWNRDDRCHRRLSVHL